MTLRQKPQLPLFITGHPRSGTTLLRLVFNAHSQLGIPDETGMFHWFYKRPWYKKYTRSKIPIPSPKESAFGRQLIESYNHQSRQLRNDPLQSMNFLYENWAKREGKPHWGDKTPLHTQFSDQIFELYPSAFIINLVRDPRAVISSAKRNLKNKREGTDFWISDDLDKTINRWLWEYDLIKKYHQKYPDQTYILRYEDFVADSAKVVAHLCRMIGIPYESEMLNYHVDRKKEANGMEAWHKETTKPVNADNLKKWQKELDPSDIEKIESILARPMKEQEYLY